MKVYLRDFGYGAWSLFGDTPDGKMHPVWVGEGLEETVTADPDRADAIDGRHSFPTREEAIEAINEAGLIVHGDGRVMRVSF